MGNVDSRSRHEHGYLITQTEQPFYSPGQMITGSIFVRCTAPIHDAKLIEIEVKGKEKVSFIETIRRGEETHHEKRKVVREIIHYNQPAFVFTGPINPGDFSIPFQFPLPMGLPSSLFFKRHTDHRKPSAKVKYHIKASLIDHHGKKIMTYKQVVMIREMIPQGLSNISSHSEHDVKTGCC
jgi:hypothetical protein